VPEPPHGLELSLRTHNSVFVTWQRPHDNGLPVEGFRVVVVMEEGDEGDEGKNEGKDQPNEAKEEAKEGKEAGKEEGKEEGQETAVAATIGGVDKTSSSNSNTCVQFVDLDHTGLPPTSSGIEGRLQVGQV
jgi:hypothetical protein